MVDERIEQQLKRLPAKPGVYLFRDAGDGVGAQVVHPLRPRLDHLGECILSRDALVDRQPPPRGIDLVERVCDVLAGHWPKRSGALR